MLGDGPSVGIIVVVPSSGGPVGVVGAAGTKSLFSIFFITSLTIT